MESKTKVYHFDDIVAEPAAFRVSKAGQPVQIEPKAFEVLSFLIENRGRLIEKDELLDAIWKDAFVTQNAMTRVIAQLRKALGDDAKVAKYIETVPTRGYRFIATVETPNGAQLPENQVPQNHIEAVQVKTNGHTSPQPTDNIPGLRTDWPGTKRVPTQMVVWASLIMLILAVAVFLWRTFATHGSPNADTIIKTTQITTWTGLDLYPALSPDGNSIAYSSDHQGSFEIYIKPLTPGAREIQITSDGKQNFQPAWSSDGKMLAYCARNNGIWIVPASGGIPRQLTEFGGRPTWSPDGNQIALQSMPTRDVGANAKIAMPPSTIWIAPVNGGAPKRITQTGTPSGGHGSPSWTRDGKGIIFSLTDWASGSIWWVSSTGGEAKLITKDGQDPISSPADDAVYYVGAGFDLYKIRISPDTGDPIGPPVFIKNAGATNIRFTSISVDGKKIAYSAETSASNLWSIPISPVTNEATGPPVVLAPNTNFRNLFPMFSPDGSKIAYFSWRTTAKSDIWLVDPDGKNPTQLTTNSGSMESWFPSGDSLVFMSTRDGRRGLYSIGLESHREKLLQEFAEPIEFMRMSPDAQLVAYNSKSGGGPPNVWIAPVEGGQPKQLTFDKEFGGFPSWSRDGKFIAYQSQAGDDTNLYVIPREGGPATQLTHGPGQHWGHDWSPDNDKISYVRLKDDVWNICWVSRATKEEKQVTNYTKQNAYVRYPAWSPRGNQIVYEYTETTGNIWMIELK